MEDQNQDVKENKEDVEVLNQLEKMKKTISSFEKKLSSLEKKKSDFSPLLKRLDSLEKKLEDNCVALKEFELANLKVSESEDSNSDNSKDKISLLNELKLYLDNLKLDYDDFKKYIYNYLDELSNENHKISIELNNYSDLNNRTTSLERSVFEKLHTH